MTLFPASNRSPGHKGRRAAAAVEFALVAPLLVMLILGMVELGRMLMVQQILTNSAREGARKAVLPGVTQSQVEAVMDDYLQAAGIQGHTCSVPSETDSAAGGTAITVSVSVPYGQVTWLPVTRFLKNKTLWASVVMRKEDR
jgi:Flp pilus assembly protein TadG